MAKVKRIPNLLVGSEAISIEGGLLSPEWLSKIAQLQAIAQSGSDYGIPKGLTLRDEIGRYWRISEALWQEYQAKTAGLTDTRAQTEKFVNDLFKQCLGFDDLKATEPVTVSERIYPIRAAACNNKVPIVISSPQESLDKLSERFGEDQKRRTAFGLLQEYLNASDNVLWGIVCDGESLRIVRDNSSLTKPAWISVELRRIFDEQIYADFAVFWLLCHRSRFETPEESVSDCILEKWKEAGRAVGTRARDQLRIGVEEAIELLGQGFLANTDNNELRLALQSGRLTTQHYFQELLRVVYRLIFLITIEERDLIHPEGTSEQVRNLYLNGYGVKRLREKSIRRTTYDRFSDLWDSLKIVFKGLGQGESRLGLPALGGLFDSSQTPILNKSRIDNGFFLQAVLKLYWLKIDTGVVRVNWRDMGPEELGSVYESLLELNPLVSVNPHSFSFDSASKSAARKGSGSYYTKDELVQTLLDNSLEPLLDKRIAEAKDTAAKAILEISVLDPACGSAHFLLGAARRIAVRLARIQTQGTPTLKEYRSALRSVISHCVYGVDRNPMALELARIALWLEAMSPDQPLTFIDHHLVCGDALLGITDFEILNQGISNEAFKALDGDEPGICKTLITENSRALRALKSSNSNPEPTLFDKDNFNLTTILKNIEEMSDDTPAAVEAKKIAHENFRSVASNGALALAADMYCAAFLETKDNSMLGLIPTTGDLFRALRGVLPRLPVVTAVKKLSGEKKLFHWRLHFPQVFAKGGFDVVLGNPPWDTMSPDAKEWFAPFAPEIRELPKAEQDQRIAELRQDSVISRSWEKYCRDLYTSARFMKESGRYTLFAEGNLGKGDFNVYRMFVELALKITNPNGVTAQFVPENLYNGANAAALRKHLFEKASLRLIAGFENKNGIWFPGIHKSTKFCLYVTYHGDRTESFEAKFGINSQAKLNDLNARKTMSYPVALVEEFSPEAMAIAEIAHVDDIEIVKKLYARLPKFGDSDPNLPTRHYMREMDMGNDREEFGNDPDGLPLYEGRMVEAYDYRAKAYVSGRARKAVWKELKFGSPEKEIVPQWRIPITSIPEKVGDRWQNYRIGFCDVASPTNSRSLVAALIPPNVICGHKIPTLTFEPFDPRILLLWLGVANSLTMDFLARKKISLTMSLTVMDSLPLPRRFMGSALEKEIAIRVLRLSAVGPSMDDFRDEAIRLMELDPNTFSPLDQPDMREIITAEIEVLVARDLFGITRDQFRFLLDPSDVLGDSCEFETFGALKREEIRIYQEFRTRKLILNAWDSLPVYAGPRTEIRGV